MNDTDFAAAAARLQHARRDAHRLESIPPAWRPGDLTQAYRLQQSVAEALGATCGWKISGLTHAQQQAMGVALPIAAPLLSPWVRATGATLPLQAFNAPRLECEFAFELQADLPARAAAYSRTEVEAAIGALRLAIEVVDTRLPAGSPVLMELADGLNNGAFVVGAATPQWRDIDYARQTIVLNWHDGDTATEIASGDGGAVLDGDPVGAVLLLANLPAPGRYGLRAGDIITTGSCTGAVVVPGAGDYEADFGTLGSVRLQFID